MTVDLSEISNGYTRMKLSIERTIINQSARRQDFRTEFDVRNWHDPPRMSAVTEISAFFKGTRYDEREKLEPADVEAQDLKRERLKHSFKLAPAPRENLGQGERDELTVFYQGYEDKLPSDIHWQVLVTPTQSPTVTVIHPASVIVYVRFFSTAKMEHERELDTGNGVTSQWTLKGVMLPFQAIVIRWWPKGQQ